MLPHQDIHFRLVDLPAISPEHAVPWLANTLETADACLLVVDLGDPACVQQVEALHAVLRAKRVTLTDRWEPPAEPKHAAEDIDADPFALRLPTLMLTNKTDRIADGAVDIRTFCELAGLSGSRRLCGDRPGARRDWSMGVRAPWHRCVSTPRPRGIPPPDISGFRYRHHFAADRVKPDAGTKRPAATVN
ncbi:MAG: hypothetical protein ACREXR_19655 [Gammaproteobacteria bacterium]